MALRFLTTTGECGDFCPVRGGHEVSHGIMKIIYEVEEIINRIS